MILICSSGNSFLFLLYSSSECVFMVEISASAWFALLWWVQFCLPPNCLVVSVSPLLSLGLYCCSLVFTLFLYDCVLTSYSVSYIYLFHIADGYQWSFCNVNMVCFISWYSIYQWLLITVREKKIKEKSFFHLANFILQTFLHTKTNVYQLCLASQVVFIVVHNHFSLWFSTNFVV